MVLSIALLARSSGLLGAGGGTHRLFRLLRRFLRRLLGGALSATADRQQHLALAGGGLLWLLALGLGGGRDALFLAGDAALQRVHQVDDVAAGLRRRLGL